MPDQFNRNLFSWVPGFFFFKVLQSSNVCPGSRITEPNTLCVPLVLLIIFIFKIRFIKIFYMQAVVVVFIYQLANICS